MGFKYCVNETTSCYQIGYKNNYVELKKREAGHLFAGVIRQICQDLIFHFPYPPQYKHYSFDSFALKNLIQKLR